MEESFHSAFTVAKFYMRIGNKKDPAVYEKSAQMKKVKEQKKYGKKQSIGKKTIKNKNSINSLSPFTQEMLLL